MLFFFSRVVAVIHTCTGEDFCFITATGGTDATSLSTIGNVVSSIEKTLIFLTERKVLENGVYCQKCSNWMSIVTRSSVNDKYCSAPASNDPIFECLQSA